MDPKNALCIPLTCRGLQVLGFPCEDKIYLCVHQLAIELWKAFDTPRVSIQRKINDLGIKIISSDRNMVRILRAAGIIENFRATMIFLQDAEILCDALEQSRKKRGLAKHALQSKHKPEDRSLRREEQRAKKFSCKMNTLYNLDILQSQSIDSATITSSNQSQNNYNKIHNGRCASFKKSPTPDAEQVLIDTLLVAEDPFRLESKECKEIIPQQIFLKDWAIPKQPSIKTTPSSVLRQNSKTKNMCSLDENMYKPLSSPNTETSEFDDMSSPSGRPSSSDTPERFLYIPESSESEEIENEDFSDPDYVDNISGTSVKPSHRQAYQDKAPPCRRLVATKLRHFAQATSPRTNTLDSPSHNNNHSPNTLKSLSHITLDSPSHSHKTLDSPSHKTLDSPSQNNHVSLPSHNTHSHHKLLGNVHPVVTLKRKRGRPPLNKHTRPTALSSFATKKRAQSRSPTPPIEARPNQSVPSTLAENSESQISSLFRNTDTDNTPTECVLEDEVISVRSMSTSSTRGLSQRSLLRTTRHAKSSEKEKKVPFSFSNLFNFSDPPKLIVRDGELVPELSQSVKHLDRVTISQLPSSHSFLNWALGKPVSSKGGDSQTKGSRKRKPVS